MRKSKESEERREHRHKCLDRYQMQGSEHASCLEYDTFCTSLTLCPRMLAYDAEYLGNRHNLKCLHCQWWSLWTGECMNPEAIAAGKAQPTCDSHACDMIEIDHNELHANFTYKLKPKAVQKIWKSNNKTPKTK